MRGDVDTFRGQHRSARAVSLRAALAIAALITVAGPAGAAAARQQGRASAAEKLDTVHVTALSAQTTVPSAIPQVSVLQGEELAALRGQSLAEVLMRQAGIVIDRGARSGGYGALYLRGADPSHVVVLIDHVRQNDPLSSRGSSVDLNTLSLDDIERIEIVRGNASVLHAEAIAGLVHLFTRSGRSGAGAGATVGGDTLRGAHAFIADRGWRGGASDRKDSDGAGGSHHLRSAQVGWEHQSPAPLSVRATARYADSELQGFPDDSGGPMFARLRDLQTRSSQIRQQSLQGGYRTSAGVFDLQIARISRDGRDLSPPVAPGLRDPFGLPALSARNAYRRDELQAGWHTTPGPGWTTRLGLHQQREHGQSEGRIDFGAFALPTEFALERRTDSVFAESRWTNASWSVQGGLRRERVRDEATHDSIDEHFRSRRDATTHFQLSAQFTLPNRLGAWGAALGQGSKAPSFYALGHPLVGNPTLLRERARQHELYYARSTSSDGSMRLALFGARYRDLIDFDSGPPPQLVNREHIETRGIEWQSEQRLRQDWRLRVDGSWMHVRTGNATAPLRYRPRLQAGLGLRIPLNAERDLILGARHLGRRFDSSIPTGDRWLSASTLFDIGLQQRLGSLDMVLAVDNLGNARDEEAIGVRIPGRRLRLALQWQTP